MDSKSRDNMDEAIAITFDGNGVSNRGFSGLGRNDAGNNENTIIDGSPTNINWWLAIGALNTVEDKIPGPFEKLVSKVELYMKRSPPAGDIWGFHVRRCFLRNFIAITSS